ncbi:hypothetical protein PO909_006706 [Leuciscus waleckii]
MHSYKVYWQFHYPHPFGGPRLIGFPKAFQTLYCTTQDNSSDSSGLESPKWDITYRNSADARKATRANPVQGRYVLRHAAARSALPVLLPSGGRCAILYGDRPAFVYFQWLQMTFGCFSLKRNAERCVP